MPRRRGLKERFKSWVFGSKSPETSYPDMETSPCQKCKIMLNYIKLTERAVKLDVEQARAPISPFVQSRIEDHSRYPRTPDEAFTEIFKPGVP